MSHTCHAMYCEVPVPPEQLMCKPHWFMVPAPIRREVWNTYRVGQCYDMNPSGSWHVAADRAITTVAVREGYMTPEQAKTKVERTQQLYANRMHKQTTLINLRKTGNIPHVYIGRGSPFGNPWSHLDPAKYQTIRVESRERAIAMYRMWINGDEEIPGWTKPTHEQIMSLRGKVLGCYCDPDPCHGEPLIDYIEAEPNETASMSTPTETTGADPTGEGFERVKTVGVATAPKERDETSLRHLVDVSGVSPSTQPESGQASSSSITVEGSGTGIDRFDAPKGIDDPLAQRVTVGRSALDRPSGASATGEKSGQPETAGSGPLTSTLSPFLRWAGGKRWLTEMLVPEILALDPQFYVEPFLGSGAIALAMPSHVPMILSDFSAPLMNLWEQIQLNSNGVASMARSVLGLYGNTREGYLRARKVFNAIDGESAMEKLERAGLMLYLNAVSYNGLWRESKKGGYNVPFGDVKHPAICDGDELALISHHLGSAKLLHASYEMVINKVTSIENLARGRVSISRVVIFADSPYHAGFDSYVAGGFDEDQHRSLADCLRAANHRGAKIFSTNANTEFIRSLYSWASITEIDEERSIAADGKKRQAARCVLIRA